MAETDGNQTLDLLNMSCILESINFTPLKRTEAIILIKSYIK